MKQVPDLDAILVPVSGGGMTSGIAIAAKTIKPDIKGQYCCCSNYVNQLGYLVICGSRYFFFGGGGEVQRTILFVWVFKKGVGNSGPPFPLDLIIHAHTVLLTSVQNSCIKESAGCLR